VGSESSVASEACAPTDGVDAAVEVEAIRAQVAKLTSERDQYRSLYQAMLERCKMLERGILAGQKAERLSDPDQQLTLLVLGTLLARHGLEPQAAPDAEAPIAAKSGGAAQKKAKRPPTGRKRLPAHLPCVPIEILPEEVKREGLDAFKRIGEEVCEVIERRPQSLVRVRIVRPKFVRKDRDREESAKIETAPCAPLPILRGLAGPGLIADSVVRRFDDHQPLHRMESIYAREGLPLARSTICDWHMATARLLSLLLEAMWKDALRAPYLCTDATGVLVQAKERCRTGHFWVVIAPELHVLYDFSARHDSAAVDKRLKAYRGYLVADAHTVYDHLYACGGVIEVGCWAHARRYFFKSLATDPERAREALAWIGKLFEIERRQTEAGVSHAKRRSVRQEQSKPIVEAFYSWCATQAELVLEDTPIHAAIRYATNQRKALERFLEDGQLPLHNNKSEAALRRQAVGRRNWTFLGNDAGGAVNTTFVSLLASCKLHGIEPWGYLRDLLCLIGDWPARRVLELAPAYWRKTLEQPETQQRLAANPFRKVSLGTIC